MKVDLEQLADTIGGYGFAYLVTVGEEGRAHVLAVTPETVEGGLAVGGVGRHSQENATARPDVTLVWPPTDAGGYSLLVDGSATVDGSTVTVSPTKAILHRRAPGPDGTRAGSDCAPI
jgi:hypothetical protein